MFYEWRLAGKQFCKRQDGRFEGQNVAVLPAIWFQPARPVVGGLTGCRSLRPIVFGHNPFLDQPQNSLFVGLQVHRFLNVFACS